MTMRGPYQIKRQGQKGEWNFYLYRYEGKEIKEEIASVLGQKSPIPPLSLRRVQAQLNTKAIMDNPRGWLEL